MILFLPSIMPVDLMETIRLWSDRQPHRLTLAAPQPEPAEQKLDGLPAAIATKLREWMGGILARPDLARELQAARLSPPRLLQHRQGMSSHWRADAALFADADSMLRSDLMLRIALSPPEQYGGGLVQLEAPGGPRPIPMQAGDMLLHDSRLQSCLRPVHHGRRCDLVYRVESQVADPDRRQLLRDLSSAANGLAGSPAARLTTQIRERILRQWRDGG